MRSTGPYTPIDGYDRMAVIRRSALDKAIVDTALAAGAEGRFGERVVDLIGSGHRRRSRRRRRPRERRPESGRRGSSEPTAAARPSPGRLGIQKERVQQGEVAFLFGYWRGIPDNGYGTLEIHEREFASRTAMEDGLHLLIAMGDAELTRGTERERRQKYVELLRRFPELIEPGCARRRRDRHRRRVAPESLMRGFFRKPTGSGWALLGDASHFKHPGTAQGIARRGRAGGLRRGAAIGFGTRPRGIRGVARRPGRGALRLVLRLGSLPKPGERGEALARVGERRGCWPGPARHVQSAGRALPADEQGAHGTLVRGCRRRECLIGDPRLASP